MVSGHVDGIAELMTRESLPDMARLSFASRRARALHCPKGSVALDGVSLTVNTADGQHVFGADHSAHAEGHHVSDRSSPGARLNIEVDLMARYAARLLETLPR